MGIEIIRNIEKYLCFGILFFYISPQTQLLFFLIYIYMTRILGIILIFLLFLIPINHNERQESYIKSFFWNILCYSVEKVIAKNKIEIEFSESFNYYCQHNKSAIIAAGPHGLYPMILFAIFKNYKNIKFHTLKVVFLNPITRILVIISGNMIPVDKVSIINNLRNNKMSVIYPGGVQELIYKDKNKSGLSTLHTGFIKLAKETNTPVFPLYIVNELKVWGNYFPKLTMLTYNFLKIPIPIPYYKDAQNIKVLIGDVLLPENYNSIESMHSNYYKKMIEMSNSVQEND